MRISIIESLVYRRHCASLDNYDAWDEEAGTAQVADAVTESIAVGVDRGELPSSALPAKYKPKLKRPQPMPSPSNPPPPTPLPSNPPPDEHSTPKGVAHASPPLASCSDATAPGPVEEENLGKISKTSSEKVHLLRNPTMMMPTTTTNLVLEP